MDISSVVERLIENNYTISTAESCTGGLIASAIVDSPGASKIFNYGVITYSDEMKIKKLYFPKCIRNNFSRCYRLNCVPFKFIH